MNLMNLFKKKQPLVSIETIKDIISIKGATKIELLVFNDCQCVSRIGRYKQGQTVCVVRAGAKLPNDLLKVTPGIRKSNAGVVTIIHPQDTISDSIVLDLKDIIGALKRRDKYKDSLLKEGTNLTKKLDIINTNEY